MIEKKKEKHGWEFLFLGANIDAVKEAGRFGISASRAVRYKNDRFGTQLNYKVMADVVGSARRASSADEMKRMFDRDEMLAPIRADYEERHQKK